MWRKGGGHRSSKGPSRICYSPDNAVQIPIFKRIALAMKLAKHSILCMWTRVVVCYDSR